jgi:hypothetical protein
MIVSQPTIAMSAELQAAFDHFNAELFEARLPPTLITLQRHRLTPGFYTPDGWVNHRDGQERADEIALNPRYFAVQTLNESMKALVLQMTFVWQRHYGKPGRRRYANKEYGEKLVSIGLQPSHNGKPGGRTVGEKIDAFVIEGGLFERACAKLLTKDFTLSWLDRFPVTLKQLAKTLHQLPEETRTALDADELAALDIQIAEGERPTASQVRYHCPVCFRKLWGKKGQEGDVACMPCQQALVVGDIPDDKEA